jgi:uncharacterized protein (TIGR02996 family)
VNDTLAALHKALDANPGDWGLRLIVADAHQEAGEDEYAEFLRWTAKKMVRPFQNGQWAYGLFYDIPSCDIRKDAEDELFRLWQLYRKIDARQVEMVGIVRRLDNVRYYPFRKNA